MDGSSDGLGQLLGELVGPAVGVAASPLPLIAVIVMLLAPAGGR